MGNKLLSIIIPSYNMEDYLPKCLGSLLGDCAHVINSNEHEELTADWHGKLDIIVVNDGSKDHTSEIAHTWGRKINEKSSNPTPCNVSSYICSNGTEATLTDYGIIRVIDKPNRHYGSCINAALPVAKGTYVKVLDADDTFDTQALREYVDVLDSCQNSEVDLIVSPFIVVDEDGNVKGTMEFDLPLNVDFDLSAINKLGDDLIMHGVAYRTERVRNSGYQQTEGCVFTDSEWMFAPMMTVRHARYFPKALYRYLVGRSGQSVSSGSSAVQLKMMKSLMGTYQKLQTDISEMQRNYLRMELARIYRLTIDGYFHNRPLSELSHDFIPVDETMARLCPEARMAGGAKFSIWASTRYKMNYVSYWQNMKHAKLLIPMLARIYIYLRRKVARNG